MQHIFNVAIDVDVDGISRQISENVEKNVTQLIHDEIIRIIAEKYGREYRSYFYNMGVPNETKEQHAMKALVERAVIEPMIDKALEACKAEVIEAAAAKLCNSYRNTKAYKERMAAANA